MFLKNFRTKYNQLEIPQLDITEMLACSINCTLKAANLCPQFVGELDIVTR